MLTVNRRSLEELVEAFSNGEYKAAIFPVKNIQSGVSQLHTLSSWNIKIKDFTATKDGKVIRFVFDIQQVYGRSYDYLGITGFVPNKEEFSYYMSRLREVK